MHDSNLSITALVRNKDKAAALARLGVKTVVGSLDNATLMRAEAAKADAIVQGVSSSCSTHHLWKR